MSSLRPLPIVPPPADGEALGSWLARVAAVYGVSAPVLLEHLGVSGLGSRNYGWVDLPFLNRAQLDILSVRLRRSVVELAMMNPSVWMPSPAGEFAFCRHCLAEDRAHSRPMYWRRQWLDAFAVSCLRHHTALHGISGKSLEKTRNCEDAAGLLVDHPVFAQRANSAFDMQTECAEALHRAIREELSAQARYERYGLRMGSQLRSVAVDWLDVLLMRSNPIDRRIPLIHLAAMLDVSLDAEDYRIRPITRLVLTR